jgi:Lrp/AsnC family leucine-responsive transcriptional regulator
MARRGRNLNESGRKIAVAADDAQFALDAIDRRILKELQNDGRLSNLELSDRVGLSPSPCLRRVKRLEGEGVLSRYVALIDPTEVGLDVTVFTRVSLERQKDALLGTFEHAVASWPEVMECYLMSGDSDYQLRVVVPNIAAYEGFLRQRLTQVEGIANIKSSFALRHVVYRTELPIP